MNSVPHMTLRDKAFKSIPPKFWSILAQVKNPDKRNKLLDLLEHRLEAFEIARIKHAFKPKEHRGLKSRSKKRTCQLKTDPSGAVSLSLCKVHTNPPLPPYQNADAHDYIYKSDCDDLSGGIGADTSTPSPMGLSVSLSETRSKSGEKVKPNRAARGSRGLTSLAKRLIVGSCNRLQSLYGKNNLCFHTATLPANEPQLIRLALERSKEILKYWRKVLSRYLDRKGLDPNAIVVVLELQQRGALHLHTVFRTAKTIMGNWLTPYEELDRLWYQTLAAQLPEIKGKDFRASCKTQKIKKDTGRYMAKYLSKSISKEVSETKDLSVTWYSVGNQLKQWFRANTQTLIMELDNMDFERIREVFINSRLVFKVQLLAIAGYGYRALWGYCNWHPQLIDFLELLLV